MRTVCGFSSKTVRLMQDNRNYYWSKSRAPSSRVCVVLLETIYRPLNKSLVKSLLSTGYLSERFNFSQQQHANLCYRRARRQLERQRQHVRDRRTSFANCLVYRTYKRPIERLAKQANCSTSRNQLGHVRKGAPALTCVTS